MKKATGKIHQPRPVPTPDAAALSAYLASLRRLLADAKTDHARNMEAAAEAKRRADRSSDVVATFDYRVREAEKQLGVEHEEAPQQVTGTMWTWAAK